jgi:formylmethanofuran dehydrogenase subunit C
MDPVLTSWAIATAKNAIIVSGFAGENVVISTADGKVVANGIATDNNTISVPAGIYVVKAGSKSAKVVVK